MSGSVASHSTIRLCAFSKSCSCTMTFAFACGLPMKATVCICPSLWTSAFTPDCCRRSLRCLALGGSLKVAIVTINHSFRMAAFVAQIKHQLASERKIVSLSLLLLLLLLILLLWCQLRLRAGLRVWARG